MPDKMSDCTQSLSASPLAADGQGCSVLDVTTAAVVSLNIQELNVIF